MYNRSNKLFIKPKFFHYTTSHLEQQIIKDNFVKSQNKSPSNKKGDAFYHTILINATKLQNFQKSRFFSSISKSENENNKPVEKNLKNLTMIKKDLKSLLDKEMDNFQIDEEQEKYAKQYLEEMKYKITVEQKENVILTRNVDEYLITISFKGDRIFLNSSFSKGNFIEFSENEDENDEISEDGTVTEDELLLNESKNESDKVFITIQTAHNQDNESYTLNFECHILGQKLYIKQFSIDKDLPKSDDNPLVFQENNMGFDELNPNVQSRMYDFLDEFGVGDRLVNFIDFYRSSRAANNFRGVLQYFKNFLDK